MQMTPSKKIPSDQNKSCEDNHTGESVDTLKRAIMDNLYYREARVPAVATRNDWYLALAYTVRDRILARWIKTLAAIVKKDVRVVSYLSAEFLMGPHLVNNMINLGIYEQMKQAAERAWGWIFTRSWSMKKSPAWATAAWAGWQPVSWTLSPPWK